MIERLCIIGAGLIGGSLARALRAADYCREVVGCSRNPAHLQQAVDLGVIDRFDTDPVQAVAGADMVLVAVPLGAMEAIFTTLRGHLGAGTVITDVGSAKAGVVEAARRGFGELPPGFVPGHPIAGTEKNGVEASFAELYRERRVILTPLPETDRQALARVSEMWSRCGASVTEMEVAHHDEVLAATSHLPHMLAFSLVDSLARLKEHDDIFRYAAGGFRDFTRIASSNPVMWRDICLANRDAVVAMVEHFSKDLDALTDAMRKRDADAILKIFTDAKSARDAFAG